MGVLQALRSPGRRGADPAAGIEIRRLVRLALGEQPVVGAPRGGEGDHPTEYALACYIEGRTTGPAAEAFERHAAACAACARELILARRTAIGRAPAYSRRAWRIAAALAVAIGGLIAALLAAAGVGGRIDAAMLAGVRGALGGRVQVEGASLVLAGGPGVELSNVKVPDPTGGEPIVVASTARWTMDLAGLRHGEVHGSLRLHGPIINVVREPSGGLNIDAILPQAGDRRDVVAEARREAVRAVEISGGTVRLVDRSGGERREIRMAAVDASLTGIGASAPAHVVARAGVESSQQNLSLEGEIGPWGGMQEPSYRFSRVLADAVSVRNLPGIGSVMRGGLSFDGNLASTGDTWAEISSRFSGGGDVRVVAGAVAGRNLVAEVLGPVLGTPEPSRAPSGDLAVLLASADTPFGEIQSPVRVAGSGISASDLRGSGNGYAVAGHGSLGGDGNLDFSGDFTLQASIVRDLVAAAPSVAALVDDRGEISVPFSVAGVWPDVRVAVDVEQLAARTVLRRGLARLLFLRPGGILG